MAIPADPTIALIVTEALKRGGITNPSAGQITDATAAQFREVKEDIHLTTSEHPSFLTTSAVPMVVGKSRYTWPTDARDIRTLVLLDAPDSHRGLAQAGAASTITLAATFSAAELDLQGKFIGLVSGTGTDQHRQITAYNDTTKVVTVDSAWTTAPAVSTGYMIATYQHKIWQQSKENALDLQLPYIIGLPVWGSLGGREVYLNRPPERVYMLIWDYWFDLDRIDDTGTVFTRFMRDFRTLWIQGIAVKVMQRFDDERYPGELQVYNGMLAALSVKNNRVGQVVFTDV